MCVSAVARAYQGFHDGNTLRDTLRQLKVDVWQLLARLAAFDHWTNLIIMRPTCFTPQQCAKLLTKRLQLTDLVFDFS
jgi:hypothetical protein